MKVLCTKTGECTKGDGYNRDHCLKGTEEWQRATFHSCPYRVRTGLAEVIDWRERYEEAKQGLMMWQAVAVETDEAFSNMAAAFEELAGEHRELLEYCQRLLADNAHSQPECPGPGWYWTRGYWTPPRSRVSPNGETAPTSESSAPSVELCKTEVGDTDDTGEAINGPPGASGGQPEVFQPVCNPGQTLWQCEDCGQVVSRLDHDCEGAE
jgi:hypothetical protein